MATIGLLAHQDRPVALGVCAEIGGWLAERGHQVRLLDGDEAVADGLDLAVSLGGDGTMLRTVRLAAPAAVPVLGVNLGHLGYLSAVEPDGLRDALERFLAGEHRIEARMTLDVTCGGGPSWIALNDVVLQRPDGGHTVRVEVAIDGRRFVGFAADAVIVATPTGSTAYNLSARGPIVSPRARVAIITPVAPHSLFDRSLVLDASEAITVTPDPERPADLVVDGWPAGRVPPGGVVGVRAGRHDALLVGFAERAFQDVLALKFHLGER